MRSRYEQETGLIGPPAWAELVWSGLFEGYILHMIEVPRAARGQGHGRSLLDQVLKEADNEGVVLLLAPEAGGGLTQDQLISWYYRKGFRYTRSMMMMEREPEGGVT